MFTAAKIRDGRTYLEGHLSANDYYSENERVTGKWVGKGAQQLGIAGDSIAPNDRAFENFRNNRLPDGSRMTPRDGEHRIRFHDIQCSAQKSISIMAVTAGDSRLLDAHERATELAYAELEKFAACQANTLSERYNQVTGNLVAAKFTHTASRALDPQVHSHFVTVAATYCESAGAWRALNEAEMFSAIHYAGRVYQNAMAAECLRLGYEIRYTRDSRERIKGFEIIGVDDEILERFSKRREQIEAGIKHFIAKHGREPSAAEVHAITILTRDPKLKEVTTPEVILGQLDQLSVDELASLEALKLRAMERARNLEIAPEFGLEQECLRRAIAHTYERECTARGHDLLAEALSQRLGRLNPEILREKLNGPELVRVPMNDACDLKDVFVTPAGMRREQWILAVAAEDQNRLNPLAQPESLAPVLSPSQAAAAKDLLGCRDRIASLRGAAGVGKTFVLREVDKQLREAGREVAHCAPTASAADTLRKDGLAGATTLASFMENSERSTMPAGSVVIVDESGLASHRDGAALLRLALKRDWRVIFTGDVRQHTSVDAGDFLRLLETHGGVHRVELNDIRRQTDLAYREAIRSMSTGATKEGLSKLDALGWVREGGPDYLENAAAEYTCAVVGKRSAEGVICVAPTWAENHALTESIRAKLKAAELLGPGQTVRVLEPLSWTTQEKREAARYRPGLVVVYERDSGFFRKGEMATVVATDDKTVTVRSAREGERRLSLSRGNFEVCSPREIEVAQGDRLLLRANDKRQGLINGKVVEVQTVDAGVIRTTDGLTIDSAIFARFAHGYVATSHKSQGMTADRVIVAAGKLDAKAAYVACSRGRSLCTIHTPDRAALLGSVPSGDRPLAVEQVGFAALLTEKNARSRSESDVIAVAALPGPWSTALAPLHRAPGLTGAHQHLQKENFPHEHRKTL